MTAFAVSERIESDDYRQFLAEKVCTAPSAAVELDPAAVNPILKPHQQAIARWMVQGGRRACFAAFGLGKTLIQLEAVRLTLQHAGGRGLVVIPLGVRQEFVRDAAMLGIEITFIRRIEEAGETGIYLTNYETVRDGKLDPREFTVASLDEASVLRGFGGTKTFREFMRLFAGDGKTLNERTRGADVPYRFVATATPSPNDYIELLSYAAYLGIMDVSAAKTRFFKRDSTKADVLTLHPHKVREFWLWVASWAIFVQRPSDLGFDDAGYELPPLDVRWHQLATDHRASGSEKDGQSKMFKSAALGVVEASREKRDSLEARVAKMVEIIDESPEDHFLLWHDLEAEREAIEEAIAENEYGHWLEFKDGHPAAVALYDRHYSARELADRKLILGPGSKVVLLTRDRSALFAWRKFIDDSGQEGVNCAVFRNEGVVLSSGLIREAMAIAWSKWPGERLYTFVDPDKVTSPNPGYCFLMAGWKRCGVTAKGLVILEAFPAAAVASVTPRRVLATVYGSQDDDAKERHILDFSDGKVKYLAGKPVMLGSGCNFQRHCHRSIFLGIGFKFGDFIQAIHRIQRFLQTHPVRIDLIYTEAEAEVRRTLERKWKQYEELVANMTEIIRKYGLSHADMARELTSSMGVAERVEVSGERYTVVNNDCVDETRRMESNSVGLILTSIPFSTQYEYSPNYADFGHTDNNDHFFRQMDFLTPELLRVLQPGRIAAIHVKDRIVPGGMTGLGFQVVYPFHARCIEHYTRHGFAYMGMKTIVTDVVRENNQTYRLGWSEQCKDGSKMGVGMPEYLLLFRKPPTDNSNSYADVPVVKAKPLVVDEDGSHVPFGAGLKAASKEKRPIVPGSGYSRSRWQIDAHGFMRSSGDRPLMPEDLVGIPHERIFKLFREYSLTNVYDFEHHVRLGEELELRGSLPVTFMLLQPQSWSDEVWSDITRMLTLNGAQSAKGKEMHLCPMQFDLADRVIEQMSNPGDEVYDPFGGLMTVPYRAILKGRRGRACELSLPYFLDGVAYCKAAEEQMAMPSLFDLAGVQGEDGPRSSR